MKNKQKIGFTASSFDLIHPGHIFMLEECKNFCDYLIVGLMSDPTKDRKDKNKPIQTLFERYASLSAIKYIDKIIPYESESDLEQIFLSLPINIRFIGEDYLNKDFTAKKICEDLNIEIFYNSRKHKFSSSEIRKRVIDKNG